MPEIEAIEPNGYTAVSTFSGCGGSCLGYRMAGFRVAWASEFIPAAQATYKANHPGTILDTRDIRAVEPRDILDAVSLGVGEIDLFDGSPPCASFSTAGKREAGWGRVKAYSDTKQRTDDLFYEFSRLVKGCRPKVFVAENVSGLVKGVAKGYFLDILRTLKGCGYNVAAKVLDAQWLGVPQARQRLIFIGVRDDLGVSPAFPKPLPYRYSVRDAIPWIRGFEDGKGYSGHVMFSAEKPMDTVSAQRPIKVEAEADISRYAIGKKWDEIGPGGHVFYGTGLARPRLDGPSPTVTQTGGQSGAASVLHPTEKRKFSIAELRRICGFPDDFILTGTYAQQWERLGRAVPPVMMAAIATTVRDEILCRIPR
jgi:DNA (cytosine-5)-methyltransferase 1